MTIITIRVESRFSFARNQKLD